MIGIRSLPRSIAVLAIVLFAMTGALRAADGQTADDIARFLAGMTPSANSPLIPLTDNAGWKQHASAFDSAWKSLDDRQLSKVRDWSEKNIKQSQPVLYYMFSGPDFLYANAFFPNAKTIVMSGLEPTGAIPQLSDLSSRSMAGELGGIRAALDNIFRHSYFITSQMGYQLARRKLSGTLPILYVFIARSGKTIRDVSLVAIDKDGKLHSQDEPGLATAQKGVKIVFAGSDGNEQTLYYFRTDLSNNGVAKSGFLQFCEGFGAGDSFVKSASYLLHNASFSTVRDFLLKNSVELVQDDTGIPVKFLDAPDWDLRPFGTYLRPIAEFRHNEQPKLVELFRKNSAGPLDFTVGYHWGAPSNLLLAVKSTPKTVQ
jgi:hypothetical protein